MARGRSPTQTSGRQYFLTSRVLLPWRSHLGQFLAIHGSRYTSRFRPRLQEELARFTDGIVFCVPADPCCPFLDLPSSSASQVPYEYKSPFINIQRL